jgi:molybdopterin synthase sulfur carrier subunit
MIRVVLPAHLRTLARVESAVVLTVPAPVTIGSVLDALELRYPMLRGTIRDAATHERRPFLRFFVCAEDWSHGATERPLPPAICTGAEPLIVLGAIAGG